MKKAWTIGLPGFLAVALIVGGILYGPEIAGRFAYAVEAGKAEAIRADLKELSKKDALSPLFRAVAKSVNPAVVEVRVAKKVHQQTPDMEEFFRRFRPEPDDALPGVPQPRRQPPDGRKREFFARGLGSGFIVDAKNGYVMTNYHVVAGADEVEVFLADGRHFKTEWVRSDPMSDLAVLKIPADKLMDVPFGDSDAMEVGDIVLAIGAPRGLSQTVTTGIISAKGRSNQGMQPGVYQDYLQTDAAINRGNSGGPLVNTLGEVIGINNSIMSYSGGFEGIGFAVPSNMAKRIFSQLVEKGQVTRGFLGVAIQDVGENLARDLKLPNTRGALVSQVTEGSPAEKAGIKVGDFLVAVNGSAVDDVNRLRNKVAAIEPGKEARIDLYRDGKKMTVKVTLIAQPAEMARLFRGEGEEEEEPAQTAATRKFALEVATATKELADKFGYKTPPKSGVVITLVEPGSDAAEQGLAPGMVITRVQDKEVKTAEDFQKALSAKESAGGVRLLVTDRNGGQRFVFITPAKEGK